MVELCLNNAPGVTDSDVGRNDVGVDQPLPVDSDRMINSDILTENNIVINTGPKDGPAIKEERYGSKLWTRTVEAEQRAKYIGRLIQFKVGTNRIECNQVKSRRELRKDSGRMVKEIIDE